MTAMEGTGTRTSTTLLEAVAAGGNQGHCRQFVERYGAMVRALAAASRVPRNDTEDLVQEVMLAAVEALRKHRYDREKGRFKAWIKGVVRHKIIDARQQSTRTLFRAAGITPGEHSGGCGIAQAEACGSVGSARAEADGGESRAAGITPDEHSGDCGVAQAEACGSGGSARAEACGSGANRYSSIALHNHAADVPDPHPSPAEAFEAVFEAEWRKILLEEALDEIRNEIDPATYQAFDLYARKNMPPGDVAKLLGLSRNSVYVAKTRVLERVREKLRHIESNGF